MDKQDTTITDAPESRQKQNEQNNNSKKEELYNSIVEDIKKKYDYKLSETEAHEAARNLIEFVSTLLKCAREK